MEWYVCISSRGPLPPLDLELYPRASQVDERFQDARPRRVPKQVVAHLCDFIASTESTVDRYPTIRESKLYGDRFKNWATIVGQKGVIDWASKECPELKKVESIQYSSSFPNVRMQNDTDIEQSFSEALNGPLLDAEIF